MKFYLVKEKEVNFSAVSAADETGHYVREVKLHAALQFGGNGEDWLSERDCKKLKNLLESKNSETGKAPFITCPSGKQEDLEQTLDPLDWTLFVAVGMIGSNANNRDFVRVTGADNGNNLERLKHVLSGRGLILKLKVEVKNLTSVYASKNITPYTIDTMGTYEVDVSELSETIKDCPGAPLHTSEFFHRGFWSSVEYRIKGVISIIGNVHPKLDSILSPVIQSQPSTSRQLLEKGVGSDVTINTKDGLFVKCHKCVLSLHSPILEQKFKSSSEDSKMGIIKIEMSEKSVKAFLAYLYYSDLKLATEKCATTLELFQAALEYNIPSLEGYMRHALLTKPDSWYDVDLAIKLFLFARGLDDETELKMRAVKLLKINQARLQNSTSYDQLFKENPVAAKELCQHAFSLVKLYYIVN